MTRARGMKVDARDDGVSAISFQRPMPVHPTSSTVPADMIRNAAIFKGRLRRLLGGRSMQLSRDTSHWGRYWHRSFWPRIARRGKTSALALVVFVFRPSRKQNHYSLKLY